MDTNDAKLRTNYFLKSYEEGNRMLDELFKNALRGMVIDVDAIINSDADGLKIHFEQMKAVLAEESGSPFEKVAYVGNVLTKLFPEILNSNSSIIKNKGIGIISNYLGVVKESQDKRLMSSANQLLMNLESFVPKK